MGCRVLIGDISENIATFFDVEVHPESQLEKGRPVRIRRS